MDEKHFKSVLRLVQTENNNSKPSSSEEEVSFEVVPKDDGQTVAIHSMQSQEQALLQFDSVSSSLSPSSSVIELVNTVLQGYHGTLISLGHQSTDHLSFILRARHPGGVVVKAAKRILHCIKKLNASGVSANLVVPCSYILFADEIVYDLLQGFKDDEERSHSDLSPSFQIIDSKVVGVTNAEAKRLKDVVRMISHGEEEKERILSSNPSRVHHCAFTIGVEYAKFGSMFAPVSGTLTIAVVSVPDNIDLKNLESIPNVQSLLALFSVVKDLTLLPDDESLSSSVSYCNSILTQFLQAAMGGNCKTLLISHLPSIISPQYYDQCISLMELASKARNIENKPDKTELAEKALMDAYRKELKRLYDSTDQTEMEIEDKQYVGDDEVLVAQALASAVRNEDKDDKSDESEDEDLKGSTGISHLKPEDTPTRPVCVTLKSKRYSTVSNYPNTLDPETTQNEEPEDVTIDALVALIQDPDDGVPRALESSLTDVKIHRGKGSVFSGAAIVQWLVDNISGVENEDAAEQLGQKLLDKGAIFHSDGSSLFLNAQNLFYYARDPHSRGKILSTEEIQALLSLDKKKKIDPTVQLTQIEEKEEANKSEDRYKTQDDGEVQRFCSSNKSMEEDISLVSNKTSSSSDCESVSLSPKRESLMSTEGQLDPYNITQYSNALEGLAMENETDTPIDDGNSLQSSLVQVNNEDGILQHVEETENVTESITQEKDNESRKLDAPDIQDIQEVPDLETLETFTDYPHPLHFASAIGKESGVIKQLVFWYGVDCIDEKNRTPLMFAALGNKASVCRVLIECGASLDRRDNSGLTAIHIACYHGSKDALAVLLSKKANLSIRDRMYHSVYHWSTIPESQQCLKTLLRYTRNSSLEEQLDRSGLNPLHWAIFYNHPEHLKLMIPKCQNIVGLDSSGRTLMTYAIEKQSDKCVQVLLGLPCSIELVRLADKNGLTPLHHASAQESPIYVALLLNMYKDQNFIDAKDMFGRSPFHYATVYQRTSIVELLLHFGAKPSLEDNNGNTPLQLAESYGDVSEEIKTLIRDGPRTGTDTNTLLVSALPNSTRDMQNSVTCIII